MQAQDVLTPTREPPGSMEVHVSIEPGPQELAQRRRNLGASLSLEPQLNQSSCEVGASKQAFDHITRIGRAGFLRGK